MSKANSKTKIIKNCIFKIDRDSVSHLKGSNRLEITRKTNDVYFSDSTVSMTIQEAKALKTFLDQNLK